jgi:hypothetical protein
MSQSNEGGRFHDPSRIMMQICTPRKNLMLYVYLLTALTAPSSVPEKYPQWKLQAGTPSRYAGSLFYLFFTWFFAPY